MPTIAGVLETSLYVEDLDRSTSFYEKTLGLTVVEKGDRLVAMRVADRQILLLCLKGLESDDPIAQHGGYGRLHLALAIAPGEYDEWRSTLRSRGVPVEHEHTWTLGGRSLYFRDPDGHLIELATPGVWTIY